VGVSYLAAWRGLIDAAALGTGDTLAIIGASGGVGSAAAQIARRLGAARIIGVDRSEPHPASAIVKAADTLVIGMLDTLRAVRGASDGYGASIVFDCVGGEMFQVALACLAPRGRLVEISGASERDVRFNLVDFYRNKSRLFGVNTLQLDLVAAAEVLGALRPGFETGDYEAAPSVNQKTIARAASLV
jgi:NADPH:quinone reductase